MTQADQSVSSESWTMFSWPMVALVLGLGLLVLVAIAIHARSSAFEIVVEGEGRRLVFDFDKEELNLSELLDRILSPQGAEGVEAESERRVVRAVLNQHKLLLRAQRRGGWRD